MDAHGNRNADVDRDLHADENITQPNVYPDLTMVKGEWLLFAYCAKRLTIAQKQWADALQGAGADMVVVDAAQVDKWLGPVNI